VLALEITALTSETCRRCGKLKREGGSPDTSQSRRLNNLTRLLCIRAVEAGLFSSSTVVCPSPCTWILSITISSDSDPTLANLNAANHPFDRKVMTTFATELMSLAEIGKAIFRLFQGVAGLSVVAQLDPSHTSTLKLIHAEGERFKLWAANLGLLVPGHGSLDYRVREAEGLASTLKSFLLDLNESVEEGTSFLVRGIDSICA
jgi:hypothetical protein